MTKNEKKEVFLLIIENWFNDNTGQINSENCIGFYIHFINCLEFESKFSPEYEDGFNKFLLGILEWLSNFDSNIENDTNKNTLQDPDGLKEISSKFSNNTENLELFLSILKNLYFMSKEEFLL